MLRRALYFALLLALTSALASCGKRQTDPAPPTPADPVRIVSLSPAISIILTDLGLGPSIVGRHGWDQSLSPDLPVVGDQTGIDYEKLARVHPTHIVLERSVDGPPGLLLDLAEKRHWTILTVPLLALDDIPAAVTTLAAAFSSVSPEATSRAAALLGRMNTAWRTRPDLAHRAGRTLCVYWISPIGVAGPGSFHHDLLGRLGLDAVPRQGGPYITLDLEDLKRLDPDFIMFLTPDLDRAGVDAALKPWRSLHLAAIESGRIAVFNQWRYLTPSPAMIDLADQITQVVSTQWPGVDEPAGELRKNPGR